MFGTGRPSRWALAHILVLSFSIFFLSSPNLSHCRLDVYHTSTHDVGCGLSANLERMSEMCCTWLARNAGPKKSPKICHLGTIVQLSGAISSQIGHVLTTAATTCMYWQSEKNLLNSNTSPTCPHDMVNLWRTNSWDPFRSLEHPNKFQRVSHLGSVTARHLVVGVSQTLRRWTVGATYIRQGGHRVGHWPTFYFHSVLIRAAA